MDFGSSSSGAAGGQKISEQELMTQVQQQLALANFEQFIETVRKKCFERCITKPGTSISSGEQQCITRCCDRYSEAVEVVTKSLFS